MHTLPSMRRRCFCVSEDSTSISEEDLGPWEGKVRNVREETRSKRTSATVVEAVFVLGSFDVWLDVSVSMEGLWRVRSMSGLRFMNLALALLLIVYVGNVQSLSGRTVGSVVEVVHA